MRYAARNNREILTLDPAFQVKVYQLIERLKEIGEDVLITGGKRTSDEQDDLYAQGRTKPGNIVTHVDDSNSFHVHGVAIDVVPVGPLGVPLGKRYWLEWTALRRYDNIAREAQQIGLTWGYKEWGFDRPHFHYTQGISISDFKRGRRLSVQKAKREWLIDLEERMKIAQRAYNSPVVSTDRKGRLLLYLKSLERKIERVRG